MKPKTYKLKQCKEGVMPKDFWNYKINPMVGYRIPPKIYVQER